MQWSEQGTASHVRYAVIPRTLVFLAREGELLLLRGAPTKRLWAGKLNGLGGHIEADEDPYTSARREVCEESGLEVKDLELRAIVQVASVGNAPGVMLLVFWGYVPTQDARPSTEGTLVWYPLDNLPWSEMVEDLPLLLPRLLAYPHDQRMIYGLYTTDASGHMCFQYTS